MITNEAKKDPKTEVQDTATWIVAEALRDPPAATNDEFAAVIEMYEEDCDALGACPTTLLIHTAFDVARAVLAAQPKPLPAPPPRVLSKLRPAVR
jgi:hypothetical protein